MTKCHGGLLSSYCKMVLHNDQKYGFLSKTALLYVTFGKLLISLDFSFLICKMGIISHRVVLRIR